MTQPTDSAAAAPGIPSAAILNRAADVIVAARTSSVTRLHAELDGIISRPTSDVACREAMLDCLVRCRSLAGGIWFLIQNEQAVADVTRLPGPIFSRDDVQRWLGNLAARALEEQADLLVACPQVRNVRAIAVPVAADRRAAPREEGQRSVQLPSLVLISIVAGTQSSLDDAEMLATQCVVRAWRDWYATTQARRSTEQLIATSALLDLSNRITASDGARAGCQTLANALQHHFDARFVAVGLTGERRTTAKLTCVSGLGDFDPNAQYASRLESALSEAIVREDVTSFPAISQADEHQHLAHKRTAETTGVECVVSIPLISNDERIVGAITIGGDARNLLDPKTINLLGASRRPIGAAVDIARDREGGYIRRKLTQAKRFASSQRGKLTAVLAVVTGAIMFVPMHYRIGCRCKAEPVMRRYSLAPYDGLLENTFAQPGDQVKKGDLVARMEGRELGWELAGLTADAQRANKERDVHMADLAIADSLMSEMEMEKLDARERLLRHRLSHLEIRSPIDGIVLSGSLDRRQNYPVTVGQVLYEIAPIDQIRMEVAVPAEELMHVKCGMQVEICIDGESQAVGGEISHIQPRSETRDEQNVFIAEVVVPNLEGNLKPGMEGAVRITGEKHAIGWNLGHRAWERLTTRIWW